MRDGASDTLVSAALLAVGSAIVKRSLAPLAGGSSSGTRFGPPQRTCHVRVVELTEAGEVLFQHLRVAPLTLDRQLRGGLTDEDVAGSAGADIECGKESR